MKLIMNDNNLTKLGDVSAFLEGTLQLEFKVESQPESYTWITGTLIRFGYKQLKKEGKGLIRQYIQKVTGYGRAQTTRLISQYLIAGKLGVRRLPRQKFPLKYDVRDILLLAKTDVLHGTLSGATTKKIMEREYLIYGKNEYRVISSVSVAHIYNLRKRKIYLQRNAHFTKTEFRKVAIAERKKPQPNGKPGYIRVDTVHQGDLDKTKGVYHINAVDEVTQFEIVVSVERISEAYLLPILEFLLDAFPFVILGFHTDNGSEYINKDVAKLLNKLLIEFTKSRARKSNDNAQVESKNGSVIRRIFGYSHIEQKWASRINEFNKGFLNPYINFHRPCYFARVKTDAKGKERKEYPLELVTTPYEKFKSLPDASSYLKPGITFETLDAEARKYSDNEFAELMVKARSELFKEIFRIEQKAI
jgi:transposase InsO family protein